MPRPRAQRARNRQCFGYRTKVVHAADTVRGAAHDDIREGSVYGGSAQSQLGISVVVGRPGVGIEIVMKQTRPDMQQQGGGNRDSHC